MESERNNICKITERFEVDTTDISDSQNKISNISNCNEVESTPYHKDITNVFEIDKSANNKFDNMMINENNSENLATDNKVENLSYCNKINVDNVLTIPNEEVQEQYLKSNDKVSDVSEIPLNNKNSIVSSPTNTSQDSGTISSNDNEASPSPSDQNKIKRSISKGQISGESDMSMEKSGNSSDEDSSKRQKLNDSSYDKTTTEAESQAGSIPKFHKLKSEIKKRNYRNRKNLASDTGNNSNEAVADEPMPEVEEVNSDNVSDHNTPNAMVTNSSTQDTDDCERNIEINSDGPDQGGEREGRNFVGEDDSNEWTTASEDELEEDTPMCLKKEKPKPNWSMVPEVVNREIGINPLFQRRFYGSLHAVERLELMYKLNEHQGCVNALNFNQKGNLLASGSDDLIVVIWDWATGKKHHSFNSGHRSNMFQCKWLPFDVEYLMATCARDGQVRLLDLVRGISRKLATHHAPSHKLAVHPDTPHVIISVGEDARVFSIDIRENNPTKLLVVKDGTSDVLLYSVHSNPLNSNEFCVGGRSQSVRIYDRRKVSTPVHKLCPERLHTNNYAYVTCAVYNYNGTEVLASYSSEDIYLFDTVTPQPGDFAHRYQGHRNIATVKGVNFFGPKSEYILSGSDCGNIFIWDKNTEAIVQWMQGDEQGVVNCLEPHPHIPILATSGLDYDVKIWVPSCGRPPTMEYLENCVKTNINYPERDSANDPDGIDEQMLWILLRHMSYTERVRNFRTNRASQDRNNDDDDDDDADDSLSDNDSSDHSDSQSEGDGIGRLQCPPS